VRENKLRKSILAAAVPIGASLVAASMASAQTQTLLNTIDAVAANPTDPTPNVMSFGSPNFNPPAQTFRFEFGGQGPTVHHSASFTKTEDDTGNGGGSAKLSWTFAGSSDGSESSAFTSDIFPNAEMVTAVSFDLMVDPSSTIGGFNRYGFFQVFNRDQNYGGFNTIYSENLGDNGTAVGQWEHVSVTLSTPLPVRALTFQDFNNAPGGGAAGDNINGPETIYIDDLSVTFNVPEPISLGSMAIGAPLLLMRRRSRKSL
jgi:hypothetical protein